MILTANNQVLSINFYIDLVQYNSDIKFIEERRFEVILAAFSSSND